MGNREIGSYEIAPALMGWCAYGRYTDDPSQGFVVRFGCISSDEAMRACEEREGRRLKWDGLKAAVRRATEPHAK